MTGTTAPFDGVRVLELGGGIAVAYCGKLFADAGADVVKAEPAQGDPLRWWSASGTAVSDGCGGPLFHYLHASKRSVLDADDGDTDRLVGLLTAADVVLVDDGVVARFGGAAALRDAAPQAVVVAISPFGLEGPHVEDGVRATEFVLQAMCGSSHGRGEPDGRPLHAGGRLGEWIAGVAAAAAGAAALHARTDGGGGGELIDLSVFECMVITMGGLSAVTSEILPGSTAIGRVLELPSIEPTADGLVGFCTITAQQFQDFLVMIDRADLLEDKGLARAQERFARRAEFRALVHAWTKERSSAEIIDLASLLRIPVAPIGAPDTVADIDHFVERGVFTDNPAGFRQPRAPYRIDDFAGVPLTPAPGIGEHTGAISWPSRENTRADVAGPLSACGTRPLAGLRVLDLTAFWAGPTATLVLAALGADVIKVEGLSRPDGMRFVGAKPPSEDLWWEWGTTFLATNPGKRGLSLELTTPQGRELALRLVRECDVVIDNFSPRVMANLGLDVETLRRANPQAIVVRMPAFGLDGPWRDRVGFAQTMEQASGMAWLTGEADGPPLIPRGACDPIAGLHAVFATLAAVRRRGRSGAGALVEATMVEAALNVAAEALVEHSANGVTLMRDGNRGPVAAPQGIYRCAGDDQWVALAVVDDGGWQALCRAMGRADLGADPELADAAGRRTAHDRIDAAIEAWAGRCEPDEAVRALRGAARDGEGLAAARVVGGPEIFADAQLRARGFMEPVKHAVVGEYRSYGMPFRFATRGDEPWFTRGAPTLGEHTADVLAELLGLGADEVAELERSGVVGTRPGGL